MRTVDIYLQSARTLLRSDTSLFPISSRAARSCDLTADDRPPQYSGRFFVGLYAGPVRRATPTPNRLHDDVSVVVAITVRISNTPFDRLGSAKVSRVVEDHPQVTTAVNEVAEKVIERLSWNTQLMETGNSLIYDAEGNTVWPLLHPLVYSQEPSGGPRIVGPEHFHASTSESQTSNNDHGLLLKLTFDQGRRIRPINLP